MRIRAVRAKCKCRVYAKSGSEERATVQECRRLTINLALHYKRVMYVIHPTPDAQKARGKSVDIRETQDGSVHIEYRGVELGATAFPKDAHVTAGAIVENKRLSHVLQMISTAQRERTENQLRTKGMTLRRKDQLRKALGVTGELHRSKKRRPRPPTYPLLQPFAAATIRDPLEHVLEWAKAQTPETKS